MTDQQIALVIEEDITAAFQVSLSQGVCQGRNPTAIRRARARVDFVFGENLEP